jgi:hypothetical protein
METFRRAVVVVALLACVPFVGAARADVFVPNDRLVSTPDSDIRDPEFDPVGNRMVWQDLSGNLWLAGVDPLTGDILPRTGQGLLIDTGLADVRALGNGPEFGHGAGEVFLCYTKQFGATWFLAAARREVNGNWLSSVLESGGQRYRPLCTPPGTLDKGRAVYVNTESGSKAVSARTIDDPASEVTFTTIGGVGGRWAEGERAFVAPREEGGIKQLFWVDIDSNTVTQITSDADDKFNPIPWRAPEYNEQLISATINFTHVGIFRRIEGVWTRIYTFRVPSEYQFVSSPEPFVHNQKSYIAVVAARELGTQPLPYLPAGPSEIWIANIDSRAPFFRRIDGGPAGIRRAEPEPFPLATGPAVFYTETDTTTGRARLRVADTGLGSVAAGDSDGDGVSDDRDNCILVANAGQQDADRDGIGNICDADLNNDCGVNTTDFHILKSQFGLPTALTDLDGNGTTNWADFAIMREYLGGPPGPAAAPNLCSSGG